MDPNQVHWRWFIAGLLIGNLLSTPTTVILLSIWLIISNHPLPQYLGGSRPQDLLTTFFTSLVFILHHSHKIKNLVSVQDQSTETKSIESQSTDREPATENVEETSEIIESVSNLSPVLINRTHSNLTNQYDLQPRATVYSNHRSATQPMIVFSSQYTESLDLLNKSNGLYMRSNGTSSIRSQYMTPQFIIPPPAIKQSTVRIEEQ